MAKHIGYFIFQSILIHNSTRSYDTYTCNMSPILSHYEKNCILESLKCLPTVKVILFDNVGLQISERHYTVSIPYQTDKLQNT